MTSSSFLFICCKITIKHLLFKTRTNLNQPLKQFTPFYNDKNTNFRQHILEQQNLPKPCTAYIFVISQYSNDQGPVSDLPGCWREPGRCVRGHPARPGGPCVPLARAASQPLPVQVARAPARGGVTLAWLYTYSYYCTLWLLSTQSNN